MWRYYFFFRSILHVFVFCFLILLRASSPMIIAITVIWRFFRQTEAAALSHCIFTWFSIWPWIQHRKRDHRHRDPCLWDICLPRPRYSWQIPSCWWPKSIRTYQKLNFFEKSIRKIGEMGYINKIHLWKGKY